MLKPIRLRLIVVALALFAALLLVLMPSRAEAQSCSATVSDVDFGSPNLLSSSYTDALATLTVTCTRIPILTVVKVCPNIGEGSGGTSGASRLLRSGAGSTLVYQLYQDSNRTQGWGAIDEPELGTVPAILLGGGFSSGTATSSVTIYARLLGGQSAGTTGTYRSDFTGTQTAFAYSSFFLGTSSSCTGFTGTTILRPTFDVTAVALANCNVTTADLDFGAAGILSVAVTAQASLRVACTRNTPFTVALDGGNAGAGPTARKLTASNGDSVTYGLYRDAARAQAWGDSGSTRLSGTGTGAEQALTVYGAVPAQATPRPGVYSDRILVTVTY